MEGFKVKVPNGNYKVTFLFSETKFDQPGQRVFHLKIQDSEVLRNIDVFKAAGRDSAYTITSGMVKVDNYTLNIQFEPVVGPTFLSWIYNRRENGRCEPNQRYALQAVYRCGRRFI